MIVTFTTTSFPPPPPLLLNKQQFHFLAVKKTTTTRRRGKPRLLVCRADLSRDAPFAAAIGACVLSSLVFSERTAGEGDDESAAMDATDTRLAVMAIVGFIPYFNWLSWVFAWLDTGKRRYLAYSIVYLAPYLRTNLSLSPDESWLPISSILICILHIQLEASIKNGDIEGFKMFEEARKLIFPVKVKDTQFRGRQGATRMARNRKDMKLPSAHESREKLRNSNIFRKPLDEHDVEEQKETDWN